MNVITEAYLRDIMKENRPEVFYVPEGSLLSPSARDYLNQYKIKIEKQEPGTLEKEDAEKPAAESPDDMKAAYVDYATGAFFTSSSRTQTSELP